MLVNGNVIVGKGAVLGLGHYNPTGPHAATVNGNIVAKQPLTLYLGAITVHGNVVSNGGGDPTRNFPIKDDTVGGNLILQGWHGLWLGAIRDTVGGNLIVSKNTAADPSQLPGSDSTEVQTNNVKGNLICQGNTPAAQVNPDDGGQPNIVGGNRSASAPGSDPRSFANCRKRRPATAGLLRYLSRRTATSAAAPSFSTTT